jgi:hypothetical protein
VSGIVIAEGVGARTAKRGAATSTESGRSIAGSGGPGGVGLGISSKLTCKGGGGGTM